MTMTLASLRPWQQKAHGKYLVTGGDNFLVVATPGAGKTRFALFIARQLLDQGSVDRIEVVVPTDHLKLQWAAAATQSGIHLEVSAKNAHGRLEHRRDFQGCVVTYQQVGMEPSVHRRACTRTRTLVILDEIHHAGDEKSWGRAVRYAFEEAERRLSLSGTPFRTDRTEIPFVRYERIDDSRHCLPDYTYPYGTAIRDGVCRLLEFRFFDAEMRYSRAKRGRDMFSLSGEISKTDLSQAMTAALDPDGPWSRGLLHQAVECLRDLRTEVHDAGGLVLATDAEDAQRYADMLQETTGERPTLVLSKDGPEAKTAIERYANSTSAWIVAIRMVAEGVDIPRVSVEVYLTRTRTLMFFIQAIGRAVRRRPGDQHAAVIFLPAIEVFREIAGRIEDEIQQAIEVMAQEEQEEYSDHAGQGALDLPGVDRQDLHASDPILHDLYFRGDSYPSTEQLKAIDEMRTFGIPQHLLGTIVSVRRRAAAEQADLLGAVPAPAAPPPVEEPRHIRKRMLRSQLTTLVSQIAYLRLGDTPTRSQLNTQHARLNSQLNGLMGVKQREQADVEQLLRGIKRAESWLGELKERYER